MTALFGAITLGVLILGWSIAGRITRPLTRLVEAVRSLSLGDLTARSGVSGADEVGVLAQNFDAMAERMQRQQMATIGALATAIDARDPYTSGHSVRVGNLSRELGRELGLPQSALYQLQIGGFLHDIGKIGVADAVLLKPGALTADERRLIEEHPAIGLRILAPAELPETVLDIVGSHHERLNGAGYPNRLTAEELSAFPRIVAVADVYDAMTTERPYKSGLSPEEALRLLEQQAGQGLLDPEVIATMRRIAAAWEEFRREERRRAA